MPTMIARMIDHDRRIFNLVDLGPRYENFDDPRCDKLREDLDRINSTTQRKIEICPFPIPDISLEELSSELLAKGYIFKPTWYPTRRMRREYLPAATTIENAVLVRQEQNAEVENAVVHVLTGFGLKHFLYRSDSLGWDEEMSNRHVGVWEDNANGVPDLIPSPEERKIDLAIVFCKLSDPTGYEVFTTVRECFDPPVPVIAIVPPGGSTLATTVAAMRYGAETIIEQSDGWQERLESGILDSAPLS